AHNLPNAPRLPSMPFPRLIPALLLLCSGFAPAAPPVSKAPPAATPASQQKAQPQESPADVTPADAPGSASSVAAPNDDVPDLADIRAFTRVYSMVKQAYVDKVDDRTLMRNAIRGLLSGLDPHSEYLDQSELKDLTEDTSGAYSGLGIEVAQLNDQLRIVAPIDGTPAARAGI